MATPATLGRPTSAGRRPSTAPVQDARSGQGGRAAGTAVRSEHAPRFGSEGFLDAEVELSPEAVSRPGNGKGQGKAKGKDRDHGGFKNHGQMVKAAREAGFRGQDLAAVARGDSSVEKDGLTAIKNGDLTIKEYFGAQQAANDGDFKFADFLKGLERVAGGELSYGELLEELRTPPVQEATAGETPAAEGSVATGAVPAPSDTDVAPAKEETAPAPTTASSNVAPQEGLSLLQRRGMRFGR